MKAHLKFSAIIFAALSIAPQHQAQADLIVVNGDFQNTNGLTANAVSGWYDGVPAGWSSDTASLTFNVINYSSGNFGANLQTLGPSTPTFTPLYQSVGLLQSTGDVTLSFNILGFSATYGMAAAIFDASSGTGPSDGWNLLVSGSYDQTVPAIQTLIAPNVAANTTVGVGFWRWAGSPGVDNVSVTAIPEPGTWVAGALLAGAAAFARWRKRVIITP
jgi:hypothetical protein